MAKLSRYQETGLISADIPRLDFADIKEAGRYSTAVSESLDKISQFAFGKAQEEKKQADKLLAIQLRADYEGEVQNEISKLDVLVSTGQLSDFTQIQTQVQSLQGYARTLAQYDIEQASGLMRSISTSGNALLKKSSDLLVKVYGAEVDSKTDDTIANLRGNLDSLYQYEQDPERLKEYEAGARSIAFAVAAQNPSSLPKKMEDFDKARIAARNNAITNYFVSPEFGGSPSEKLNNMRSGNVGKFAPVWAALNEEEKQKIIASTLARYVEDVKILDQQDKLAKQASATENSLDWDSWSANRISGDELKTRLRARGYVFSREELDKVNSGDTAGAPPQVIGALEMQARNSLMSEQKADELFRSGQINLKQRNGLLGIINGGETKDRAEANDYINRSFVPNPLDPTTRNSHIRAAEVRNQLANEVLDARVAGKSIDISARARELVGERMQKEDMKALQDARERLRRQLGEIGLSQEREDWTDADLQKAGVSNADKRRQILRSVRAIQDKK